MAAVDLVQKYQSDSLNVKFNYSLAQKHLSRFEGEQADKYFRNIIELDPNDEQGFGEESKFQIAVHAVRSKKNVKPLLTFMKGSTNKNYIAKGYSNLIEHYKNEKDTAKAMVSAAEAECNLLEKFNFHNVIFSLKSSKIDTTVRANEIFSQNYNFPIHLGVTEAGPLIPGLIKNTIAITSFIKSPPFKIFRQRNRADKT